MGKHSDRESSPTGESTVRRRRSRVGVFRLDSHRPLAVDTFSSAREVNHARGDALIGVGARLFTGARDDARDRARRRHRHARGRLLRARQVRATSPPRRTKSQINNDTSLTVIPSPLPLPPHQHRDGRRRRRHIRTRARRRPTSPPHPRGRDRKLRLPRLHRGRDRRGRRLPRDERATSTPWAAQRSPRRNPYPRPIARRAPPATSPKSWIGSRTRRTNPNPFPIAPPSAPSASPSLPATTTTLPARSGDRDPRSQRASWAVSRPPRPGRFSACARRATPPKRPSRRPGCVAA